MKIPQLAEVTKQDYENAIKQLKKDSHHTVVINDFLLAVERRTDFRLENLKLLAEPNFCACITVLIYHQKMFYK